MSTRTEPWPSGTELVYIEPGPYMGMHVIAGPELRAKKFTLTNPRTGKIGSPRPGIWQYVYPIAPTPSELIGFACLSDFLRPPIKDGDATDDELREIEREGVA